MSELPILGPWVTWRWSWSMSEDAKHDPGARRLDLDGVADHMPPESPLADDSTPSVPSSPQLPPAADSMCETRDTDPVGPDGDAGPVATSADDSNQRRRPSGQTSGALHLATSTFLSLCMVLGMLLIARWMLPSLVEDVRYRWHRGELRAEYELSAEQLKRVSIDSLADVSRLVSQRMGPSVVHINLLRDAEERQQFERFLGGRSHPSFRYEGQGSGFIIDADGHILTNHHVVDHAGQIEVTLSDGRRFEAQVVAIDPLTDLAVLKINAQGLMPIEWGDSDKVVVGTPVWAVGSPFGLQQTVTFGIISGKHRVDLSNTRDANGVPGGTPYGDLMQSDVALNPGNSGGPLVNSTGQVVGVNAAILGDTFRGVSFSIPSNVARRVAELLIQQGEVPRGWLGVQLEDLDPDEASADGARPIGVRIVSFPRGLPSPAREAGLRVGDVIVLFDGRLVTDRATLMRMIGESVAGTLVPVEVDRPVPDAESAADGSSRPGRVQRLEFHVHLGRRPANL
ncbi:MAG: PDZ domain-containing protein [Planctomycetota bacterium]|nr:MAG: PDZ domain-containing protein [Planctomycetota bacterium]